MITKLLNYFRTTVTDNISYVEDDNSPKVINGIGEPVLSFVQCFKDNPKRFKLSCAGGYYKDRDECYLYTLTDTLLGKEYIWMDSYEDTNQWSSGFSLERYASESKREVCNLRGVITEDEGLYVRSILYLHYTERQERMDELQGIRKQRRLVQQYLLEHQNNVKMRNDLMEVYCNED